VQQVYANTSKVMIDAKGSGNLLYLPLDKLIQAASVPAAAAAAAEPAAVGATTPAAAVSNDVPPQLEKTPAVGGGSDYRSRSSLNSRDRVER
jgi:modulator of FtsH protease HflK